MLEVLDTRRAKLETIDKSVVLGKKARVVNRESVRNGSVVQMNQMVEKVDKLND